MVSLRWNAVRFLAFLFAVWLLASPLASASAEGDGSPLTADTVVVARRSGVVAVTLSRPLTVIGENALEVSLHHRGSVGLAALVQQDVEDPAAMLWTSLPADVACPPCPGRRTIWPLASGHDGELPAGEYRLYLLAVTGRVTASLTAPQLGGAPLRLKAQRHAPAKLEVATATAAGPTLSVGGSTDVLVGEGVLYRLVVGRSDAAVAMRAATCVHSYERDEMFAYGPGCPTGDESETLVAGAFVAGEASADFDVSEGRYGQGGSVASTAPLDDVVIASAWLSY